MARPLDFLLYQGGRRRLSDLGKQPCGLMRRHGCRPDAGWLHRPPVRGVAPADASRRGGKSGHGAIEPLRGRRFAHAGVSNAGRRRPALRSTKQHQWNCLIPAQTGTARQRRREPLNSVGQGRVSRGRWTEAASKILTASQARWRPYAGTWCQVQWRS